MSDEIENHQPKNTYTVERVHLDLGDADPPSELLERPEPLVLQPHPATPFMLVRATAFQWVDTIRMRLGTLGIRIEQELEIPKFETLLRYLYPVSPENENSYMWLYLSRAYLGLEMANRGYAFVLHTDHLQDYDMVVHAKRDVREHVGITPFRLRYKGRTIDSDLHHIHAPDFEHVQREFSLLKTYLSVVSTHE